jgi:hypothetical protein
VVVSRAGGRECSPEAARAVAVAVVGHDALDVDASYSEPCDRPLDARRRRHTPLAGEYLAAGDPCGIVHTRAGAPRRRLELARADHHGSAARSPGSGPASSSPRAAARPAASARGEPSRARAPGCSDVSESALMLYAFPFRSSESLAPPTAAPSGRSWMLAPETPPGDMYDERAPRASRAPNPREGMLCAPTRTERIKTLCSLRTRSADRERLERTVEVNPPMYEAMREFRIEGRLQARSRRSSTKTVWKDAPGTERATA